MKETEKNRSAHKQPRYLLIRSQQCQAELERVERQEEVCITNRSAFTYYVLGSCRSRQYTSEFITDHASYEEMKKNESRLESDRGTAGTTPKRGGRKRQKNHTWQVCSRLVVVETERKWSPTRCRKSQVPFRKKTQLALRSCRLTWGKPNVGAYTTTTTKLPSETAPPEAARTSEDSCRWVRTSAWSDLFFLAGRHHRQWVSSDNLCCESVSRAPRQKARPQVPTLVLILGNNEGYSE